MRTAPCRGCGKLIVWGETDQGKHIPLGPSAPVYQVISTEQATDKVFVRRLPQRFERVSDAAAMVSHFATCQKASDFSRNKKKTAGAEPAAKQEVSGEE